MTIITTAKNLELTPKIQQHIEQNIKKLSKFIVCAGESVQSWIGMSRLKSQKSGNVFFADIHIKMPKKGIRAEAKGTSWHSAFNQAKSIVKRELIKYKETKC
jgi:ribosomal subunit interface protein